MLRAFTKAPRGWIKLPLPRRSTRFRTRHSANYVLQYAESPTDPPKEAPKQERARSARSDLEGSTVALISLLGLGLGSYAYSLFYKKTMMNKIEKAFSKGYSSNELVALGKIAFGTLPDRIQGVLEKSTGSLVRSHSS